MASKFFLKPLLTIPLAPIITGVITYFMFHIHCISVHKLLYFSFFSASFCVTFLSTGVAVSISMHVFSSLFLIIISGCNFSVCMYPLIPQHLSHLHIHILVWICVCVCTDLIMPH
jgi:hypothetical protein